MCNIAAICLRLVPRARLAWHFPCDEAAARAHMMLWQLTNVPTAIAANKMDKAAQAGAKQVKADVTRFLLTVLLHALHLVRPSPGCHLLYPA